MEGITEAPEATSGAESVETLTAAVLKGGPRLARTIHRLVECRFCGRETRHLDVVAGLPSFWEQTCCCDARRDSLRDAHRIYNAGLNSGVSGTLLVLGVLLFLLAAADAGGARLGLAIGAAALLVPGAYFWFTR